MCSRRRSHQTGQWQAVAVVYCRMTRNPRRMMMMRMRRMRMRKISWVSWPTEQSASSGIQGSSGAVRRMWMEAERSKVRQIDWHYLPPHHQAASEDATAELYDELSTTRQHNTLKLYTKYRILFVIRYNYYLLLVDRNKKLQEKSVKFNFTEQVTTS